MIYVQTIYHQLKKLQHVTNNKRNISDELTLLVLFGFPDNKSGAPKRWIFRRGREACLHLRASYSIYWAVGGCFKIGTSLLVAYNTRMISQPKHVTGWDVNVSLHLRLRSLTKARGSFLPLPDLAAGHLSWGPNSFVEGHPGLSCGLQMSASTKHHKASCHVWPCISFLLPVNWKVFSHLTLVNKGFLSGVGVPVVVWWWKACRIAKKNALPEQAWSQNPMYLLSHLFFHQHIQSKVPDNCSDVKVACPE